MTKRKATIWTRDRIGQLIKLYRQHECLWNHFINSYKCKESRNKAVEDICKTLGITRFDFGKKIHNLRNQFNSEMKKLERRIEEMGGNVTELSTRQRCRWEHFESLMFLRNVIEPRPAGYQISASSNGGCSEGGAAGTAGFSQLKKLRLKYDYVSEEDSTAEHLAQNSNSAVGERVTEYQYEETTAEGDEEDTSLAEQMAINDFQNYDEVEVATATVRDELYDEKYHPSSDTLNNKTTTNNTDNTTSSAQEVTISTTTLPVCAGKTFITRLQKAIHVPQQRELTHPQEIIQLEDATTQHLPAGAVLELPPSTISATSITTSSLSRSASVEQGTPLSSSPRCSLQRDNATASFIANCSASTTVSRDQWDAFGELIASEFRHLNSDVSRKKLKRKFMQAMLEVGEEDDKLSGSAGNN